MLKGGNDVVYLEKKESETQVSVCREVANLREDGRGGEGRGGEGRGGGGGSSLSASGCPIC